VSEGLCQFRPSGESSLVEVVDLITEAIAYCPERRIDKLYDDRCVRINIALSQARMPARRNLFR
ncbi:MAG TPA: hypothetical protein VGK37_08920, partial [Casimicrobiaceae bacterium]